MNFSSISWGSPDNTIFGLLIVVALLLMVYRIICWQKVVRTLSLRNASLVRQGIKLTLMLIGLLFIWLALLRPQWDQKETIVHQEGRDLLIALDISRSMLAQDCLPNRLECAKQKIKELVKRLSCERVGLILFSGSTFMQCPLTTDYSAFYMFLDQIDAETISSGTTALDQAIKKALNAFKSCGNRKTKLLVLFTDGEDFSSNLTNIKQEAMDYGMTIFTFGVGTAQGAPIPLFDEDGNQIGHQLDKKGGVVISRLNEGILTSLSHDSGGTYIKMSDDDTDIHDLLANVRRFEKDSLDDKKISLFEEQYPLFVAISFGCLALEWLL